MMTLRTALERCALITIPVFALAGYGISAPKTVTGLKSVVGVDLVGARGATPADQRKIDRTVVGLCAAAVWSKADCARHGGRQDVSS
ncbi:hypothetical protein OV14_3288 [Ensifer adhaerens OV14]|jgi:hypothetical protein|nr:hypothetical protein OV14_3288 [Ensifer adhaerens OV14]